MSLLNLTNFDDHPSEPHWMVFRFMDRTMAAEFIEGLRQARIHHETDEEGSLMLIGVKQRDREAAIRINYMVLGRHRQPFIGHGPLRWGLLTVVVLLVLLAVAGWLRSNGAN